MDGRNQRYDANGNDTNPLEDTERAGLKPMACSMRTPRR